MKKEKKRNQENLDLRTRSQDRKNNWGKINNASSNFGEGESAEEEIGQLERRLGSGNKAVDNEDCERHLGWSGGCGGGGGGGRGKKGLRKVR